LATWDKERTRLNHDVFHHNFFHHFGAGAQSFNRCKLIAFLENRESDMGPEIHKVLNGWNNISQQFENLFDRANQDLITDVDGWFAQQALLEIEKKYFSEKVRDAAVKAANEILSKQSILNSEHIDKVLCKPRSSLASIDEFVDNILKIACSSSRQPMSVNDAQLVVDQFLNDCQEFTCAVSAIPSKLKQTTS